MKRIIALALLVSLFAAEAAEAGLIFRRRPGLTGVVHTRVRVKAARGTGCGSGACK